MMDRIDARRPLAGLCAITCLALALGCGGGGGGVTVDEDPDTLPLYLFALGDTDLGAPFEVSFSEGASDYAVAVTFPGAGLNGTWDFEHSVHTVAAGAQVGVDSEAGDPLLGVFAIAVTSAIPVTGTAPPASGGYSVTEGVVTTTVAFRGATVDVAVGGAPPTTYTFDDFLDLMGSAASDDHQRAGLAWGVLEYMLDMADFTLIPVEIAEGANLETTNPLTGDCSTYDPLTPPPGVANPGSYAFLWTDVSGNGSVGAGDDFTWSFTECWENDASDDDDNLWQGAIDYRNLTRVVSGGYLTRIGFEPNGHDGGAFFDGTLQTETDSSGPSVILRQERTLNGSFTAVWWAP